SELSAGFDTRIVTVCAANSIPNLETVTNDNPSDAGVDEFIARELADLLDLPHTVIQRNSLPSQSDTPERLALATNAGRDLIRSQSSLDITRKKYEKFD